MIPNPKSAMDVTPLASGAVRMQSVDGRPMAVRDGRPLPWIAYCDCILRHYREWTGYFLRSGIPIYFLDIRWQEDLGAAGWWTTPAAYRPPDVSADAMTLQRQAEHVLRQRADALFLVRFGIDTPSAWNLAHPDELQFNSDGKRYEQPSLASDAYIAGLPAYLAAVVDFCERHPWGNRVVGYMAFCLCEGNTALSLDGAFYDRSPAMRRAWQAWLTQRYGTNEALAAAWNQPGVTLAAAEVPHDAELRAKALRLPQWPNPADMTAERDYALLQKQLYHRWMTTVIDGLEDATRTRPVPICLDAMKQHLLGWQIQEAFAGQTDMAQGPKAFSFFLSTGSVGVGPLLDRSGFSGLITPADYQARGMGFAFEGEGLSDSLAIRNKLQYVENDARTYLSGEGPGPVCPLGAFMTDREVRAGLLRNSAAVLSRGLQHYWMDVAAGWFNSDAIQESIRADKRLLEAGLARPRRETQHAIALVYDDESPLCENFTRGYQNLALIRQRLDALGLCGIPYRMFLLSDLRLDSFPRYRCYLFPNLFKADDETLALLRAKVFRDGSLAVFGPATGITDGATVSAAGAERVLGLPMRLHPAGSARRIRLRDRTLAPLQARGMPAIYGDSYAYGPILVPDSARLDGAGVQVLGDAVFTFYVNGPGLVLKEFGRGAAGNGNPGARGAGDYAVVFSGAVPLPAPLLRALARYAGCNVWCEQDIVISADDTMVALHATEPGPFDIRLPRRYAVIVDALTGTRCAADADRITVAMEPPETKVFFLDD